MGANLRLLNRTIVTVELLGSNRKLTWARDADGLRVDLSKCHPGAPAYALKISCE
jgi:hypothetical protein